MSAAFTWPIVWSSICAALSVRNITIGALLFIGFQTILMPHSMMVKHLSSFE